MLIDTISALSPAAYYFLAEGAFRGGGRAELHSGAERVRLPRTRWKNGVESLNLARNGLSLPLGPRAQLARCWDLPRLRRHRDLQPFQEGLRAEPAERLAGGLSGRLHVGL